MSLFPAVIASVRSSTSRTERGRCHASPMTFSRIPCLLRSGSSRIRNSRRSPIRVVTSARGRPQFSEENAYSVRQGMPISRAHSTTARTERMPIRCPSTRGSPRSLAQRPFPSMMMATWRGRAEEGGPPLFMRTAQGAQRSLRCCGGGRMPDYLRDDALVLDDRSGGAGVQTGSAGGAFVFDYDGHGALFLLRSVVGGCGRTQASDLHDLLFLRLQDLVDLLHVAVRLLLYTVLPSFHLVLGNLLLLFPILDLLQGLAPDVPYRDPRILGHLLHHLDEVLAPLLGQVGDGNAHHLPVVRGVQSQAARLDRLLDRAHHLGVPGRDRDHPAFRDRQGSHLREGGGRPVIVHLDPVQEGKGRSPRPDLPQILPEGLDASRHLAARVLEKGFHYRPPRTTVPICSPRTTFRMFPLFVRLKTTIGRLLSMHREIAVASITLRFLFRTSM